MEILKDEGIKIKTSVKNIKQLPKNFISNDFDYMLDSGTIEFHENMAAIFFNDNWGYINQYGQIAIPFKYQLAGIFSEGFARIRLNKKWGYINQHGEEIIIS